MESEPAIFVLAIKMFNSLHYSYGKPDPASTCSLHEKGQWKWGANNSRQNQTK